MISDDTSIGDDIAVTPREHIDAFNNFNKYRCDNVYRFSDDWLITVTVPEEQSVTHGERLDAWIFDIDQRNQEVTATTTEFGRANMHSLEDRHMRAANHVSDLVYTPFGGPSDVVLEQVSHAKGMLSRCVKKDQWDWYTVYALLGKPPVKELNQGRQALSQLRDAAKKNNRSKVKQYISQLDENGIAKRFAYFVRRVNKGEEYGVIDEKYLLKQLHSIDATVFEHFIADCWSQTGHSTHVVPDEDDLGVDVIATREQPFPQKYLIQVKCYSPDNSIGLSDVQRYGGLAQDEDADGVYLVTTADFTHNAREWAEDKPITLISGSRLAEMIRTNELEPIVDQYVD